LLLKLKQVIKEFTMANTKDAIKSAKNTAKAAGLAMVGYVGFQAASNGLAKLIDKTPLKDKFANQNFIGGLTKIILGVAIPPVAKMLKIKKDQLPDDVLKALRVFALGLGAAQLVKAGLIKAGVSDEKLTPFLGDWESFMGRPSANPQAYMSRGVGEYNVRVEDYPVNERYVGVGNVYDNRGNMLSDYNEEDAGLY